MLNKLLLVMIVIIFTTTSIGCTTTKILPPPIRTPAVTVKDLTPRPKLKPLIKSEFDKIPIGFLGDVEVYMTETEGGFDERDMAIETLGKQLVEPVPLEQPKSDKYWYQFWK